MKTGRGYMTYSMCTTHTGTHKYTVFCSHSQSRQIAQLPPVHQGCSDTVARCVWKGVYTKHFPEPGPVSPALVQHKFRQAFPREHTVKHLVCNITTQQDATTAGGQGWAEFINESGMTAGLLTCLPIIWNLSHTKR